MVLCIKFKYISIFIFELLFGHCRSHWLQHARLPYLSFFPVFHHLQVQFSSVTSVVSDSVRPHRWKPTRLPCPWESPGKNTGVGCHFLLQYMKVKSESEVAQSCQSLRNPMDCSLPGSSVHGIFQARVLEWGAIAFSVSYCRVWTMFSCGFLLSKEESLFGSS